MRLQTQQRPDSRAHLRKDGGREHTAEFGAALLPVEALEVIAASSTRSSVSAVRGMRSTARGLPRSSTEIIRAGGLRCPTPAGGCRRSDEPRYGHL